MPSEDIAHLNEYLKVACMVVLVAANATLAYNTLALTRLHNIHQDVGTCYGKDTDMLRAMMSTRHCRCHCFHNRIQHSTITSMRYRTILPPRIASANAGGRHMLQHESLGPGSGGVKGSARTGDDSLGQ
ncbi:hypothetical protein EI94DRAFT_1826902 [Lactarius quietus]|nr:hypothetical protein EI94DRAFT_1826902 [Lactarius quietus]